MQEFINTLLTSPVWVAGFLFTLGNLVDEIRPSAKLKSIWGAALYLVLMAIFLYYSYWTWPFILGFIYRKKKD
jgi:hypothetical protein